MSIKSPSNKHWQVESLAHMERLLLGRWAALLCSRGTRVGFRFRDSPPRQVVQRTSMIRRIVLENFMSHTRTEIEPARGLTVLIGPNNCGKSAVVSALQTLCSNITGDFMVRHGEKECRVTIETDDGHSVTWRRHRGAVSYVIDGREVPGGVTLMCTGPLSKDNFWWCWDGLFSSERPRRVVPLASNGRSLTTSSRLRTIRWLIQLV